MTNSETVRELIESYIEDALTSVAAGGVIAQIFGTQADPKRSECHTRFYRQLENALSEVERGSEYNIIMLVFTSADEPRCPEIASYMLSAAQGLTIPLIGRVSDAQRDMLCAWYDRNVPRRRRLPIQDEVYRALKR